MAFGAVPTMPQSLREAAAIIARTVPCSSGDASLPLPPSIAVRSTTVFSVSGLRFTPVSTRQTPAGCGGGGA